MKCIIKECYFELRSNPVFIAKFGFENKVRYNGGIKKFFFHPEYIIVAVLKDEGKFSFYD